MLDCNVLPVLNYVPEFWILLTVLVKKVAPETFCNIFTWAKHISVKFRQFVGNLYSHITIKFGRFILIFSKMALTLLGIPVIFTMSSFECHEAKLP